MNINLTTSAGTYLQLEDSRAGIRVLSTSANKSPSRGVIPSLSIQPYWSLGGEA